MRGTISNIIPKKCYGFIKGENGQKYFFHKDDLNGNWKQLELDWINLTNEIRAVFDPISTPKGPRAGNVNLIQNI